MSKRLNRSLGFYLFLIGGFTFFNTAIAQKISENYFGVNAWMPDTIGTAVKYGKLHKNWQNIEESGAQTIRYGGIAPDQYKPTKYQYLRMVDSIRLHGMEPVLQVPFWDYQYTAQEAADIVQYINVTMNRNVKYWIIANEPNLLYNYTTAAQIAVYFKAFASAMKQVDPTIKIIGPETASFKQTLLNGLTTPGGPDDITGKDANGNYYLDIYSFHTYPFQSGNHSRSQIPSKLTASGGFQDNLTYLNTRLTAANNYHNRTGTNALKSAVTETNICYTNASNDNLYGVGVNSFIGGQFVAEIYGIGMKKGVDMMMLWSAVEGNNTTNNGGYLDPSTGKKKPLYYHYQLMADNFKGNSVNATSNVMNVKTFASKDSTQISVMILNMDSASNYNFTVQLNTNTITTSSPLKINVNGGVAINYQDMIPNQSTMLLTFDYNGVLLKKCEYSLAIHAAADLPPSCTNYNAITTSVENQQQARLDVKIFPNPSNGIFSIQLNKGRDDEDQYTIMVYNIIGQKVFEKKSDFTDNVEKLDLSAEADGAYLIEIRQGDKNIVRKHLLQH